MPPRSDVSNLPGAPVGTVDPVTFEILSHRLQRIAKEMGSTIERVGGTVNTTQLHDYMASLYRANGEILATGESAPWHVACGGFTVKCIMERFAKYDGVNEGDAFFLNDPYVSAIHQSDVYIVSPIHFEGRLVGWSASFVHVMDIGALSPGGNSPDAKEICQEGLRVPGIKLVDRGVLRKDVFDTLINMTRRPDMVALDINCQLAGHTVARSRMQELYAAYGAELIDAVTQQMIDYSEAALRKRLEQIPDGEWSDSATIESRRQTWTVRLKLKKTGSNLEFDFAGTDPQASTGVNLPYHATFGACFEGIAETLAFDLPRNHGLFRPITAVAPEGSLMNPRYPAPVSMSTTSGGATAKFLVVSVLNGLLSGSDEWRKEVMVRIWGGRRLRTSGINQQGAFYSTSLAMSPLSGSGARATMDGVETSKLDFMTCANVEWLEMNCPMLFLFRRHATDRQGAGRFRGGTGAEMAFTVHKAPEGKINGVAYGVAGLTNGGKGIFGGYPGAPSVVELHQGTSLSESLEANTMPGTMDELGGTRSVLPYTDFEIKADDVLYYTLGMGGGYGSPLDRDPEMVRRDVEDELVSAEAAFDVYGVVIDAATLRMNVEGTERERARRRLENLKEAS
jgi:N-methylhydantoinase B